MRSKRMVLRVVALSFVTGPVFGQANWQVTNTFHVGGDGGWDYVTVDSQSHRVYVTRTTHTMAIDGATGKVLGIFRARRFRMECTGSETWGAASSPTVAAAEPSWSSDLKTFNVPGSIPTVPDSDGIIYDAGMDRVLSVSGDGGVLMTFRPDIDPVNGKMDPPD